MSGMASSNKMQPETKPSQTSGYARSPGRINSPLRSNSATAFPFFPYGYVS